MAAGGLTPSVKHLRVESPEPSEVGSIDGELVGQMGIQLSVSETAVAWHHTKLVVDTELIEYGAPKEEMHLPQMAGEGNEGTKVISQQESIVPEAWHGWEDSLRMARKM